MDLRESFARELGWVSRRWRTRINERLAGCGLTFARWSTLLQLSRCEGLITQTELAALLGVEGPTLVRLLDALEKKGLIERRLTMDDRRVKLIALTPAAQPVLERINQIAREVREDILGDLDTSDLEACLTVLRHIGARLEGSLGKSRNAGH
ncbi:hypothetical protein ACG33_07165 [Steroidobacter denitrificans]|uniref:HTH marR-type domain-containing protein n=1 Tax=Steroidobacter denitrificans TaxID=465721 RepID=A0A127FBA1_STEDE|nr:MarR family transcriptional regulator [Steroidobacter denitrificans]AMN46880.1 hypothetical protein ACG33_07165 [Steroidobacter denitrificans]